MKYLSSLFLFVALSLFLFSCSPKRNLVYFSDLSDSTAYTSQILNNIEPKIREGDILGITVNTLNVESNQLFNQGVVSTLSSDNLIQNRNLMTPDGYLVDDEGNINYPVIGKIHLAGLDKEAARKLMATKILQYVKDPIINIRFLNFRVTVIGEVNRPGSFIMPNERVNILEALGLAGDMTAYGRRENVLVIRELEGKRTMVRLNLNEQHSLSSPYFYLQQNDIIYVEPHTLKERTTSDQLRIVSVILSAASILAIIATRVNW